MADDYGDITHDMRVTVLIDALSHVSSPEELRTLLADRRTGDVLDRARRTPDRQLLDDAIAEARVRTNLIAGLTPSGEEPPWATGT